MPYHVVKRGDKWVVEKKDGSKSFGEHGSEGEAQAQLRALYASEDTKMSRFAAFGLDAAVQAEGDVVLRTGKFFECGDYPDKGFSLTEDEADAAIAEARDLPINYEHVAGPLDGKLGLVRRLWRQGKDILAEYAIPKWLHAATDGEPIKVSSEWNRETKRPEKGALVLNPRVAGAAIMAAFAAGALDTLPQPGGGAHGAGDPGTGAKPMTLWEKIKAAAGFGDDTQKAKFAAQGLPLDEAVPEGAGTKPDPPALPEAVQAQFTAMSGQIAAMSAQLAAQTEANKKLVEDLQASKIATMSEDATRRLDKLVREFKITPAERDEWLTFAKDKAAMFADVLPTLEKRTPLPQLVGGVNGEAAYRQYVAQMSGSPGDELTKLTNARAKEKNISFAAASLEIIHEKPELASAHFANRPVVGGRDDG